MAAARHPAHAGPACSGRCGRAAAPPAATALLGTCWTPLPRTWPTEASATYPDREELLDYCRRSANPVGRLLLHLYGVRDDAALRESDAICSALQLINFWRDLSVDLPRGRHYLTDADCAAHGVARADLAGANIGRQRPPDPGLRRLGRALMLQGAPWCIVCRGRAGWELRLVVQGGLRILDKGGRAAGVPACQRPVLRPLDWLLRMAARALAM